MNMEYQSHEESTRNHTSPLAKNTVHLLNFNLEGAFNSFSPIKENKTLNSFFHCNSQGPLCTSKVKWIVWFQDMVKKTHKPTVSYNFAFLPSHS